MPAGSRPVATQLASGAVARRESGLAKVLKALTANGDWTPWGLLLRSARAGKGGKGRGREGRLLTLFCMHATKARDVTTAASRLWPREGERARGPQSTWQRLAVAPLPAAQK
eukprot:3829023-Pleurochrysis_carterae.AAC.1